MRLVALLSVLLPAIALSDTTVPDQSGWAAACAARVEQARSQLAQTDRQFAAASVLRDRDMVDLVVGDGPRYLVRVAPWPGKAGETGWVATHRAEPRPTRVDRWRRRDRRQGWVVASASDGAAQRFVSLMTPVVDACLDAR